MRKKIYFVFSVIAILVFLFIVYIKKTFYLKPLDANPIKLQDIKSVQIVNMPISKHRRLLYEKMLKDNFGDNFFGASNW